MVEDTTTDDKGNLSEEEQQKLAIERFLGLFEDADALGIARDKMVIVALSATLNQMVSVFGEEKTAAIVGTVPEKVMSGHFTTRPGGDVQ